MWIELVLAAVSAAGAPDGVRENCAEDWPDDYTMQEFCISQQVEAAQRMVPVVERYGGSDNDSPEARALKKCANDWQKGDGFDFTMVEFCWKQQSEALERLRNR